MQKLKKQIKQCLAITLLAGVAVSCSEGSGSSKEDKESESPNKDDKSKQEEISTLDGFKRIAQVQIKDANALFIATDQASRSGLAVSGSLSPKKLFKLVGANTQTVVYQDNAGKPLKVTIAPKKIQSLAGYAVVRYGVDHDSTLDHYSIVIRQLDNKAWLLPPGHGQVGSFTLVDTDTYIYTHKGRVAKLTLGGTSPVQSQFITDTNDARVNGQIVRIKDHERVFMANYDILKFDQTFSKMTHKKQLPTLSAFNFDGYLYQFQETTGTTNWVKPKLNSDLNIESTSTPYSYQTPTHLNTLPSFSYGYLVNINGKKIAVRTGSDELLLLELAAKTKVIFDGKVDLAVIHQNSLFYDDTEYGHKKIYKIDLSKASYTPKLVHDFRMKYKYIKYAGSISWNSIFNSKVIPFTTTPQSGSGDKAKTGYLDLTKNPPQVVIGSSSDAQEKIQIIPLN